MNKRNILKITAIIAIALVIVLVIAWVIRRADSTATQQGEQNNTGTVHTQEENTETSSDDTCSFPYEIPGSALVIEQINAYDGVMLEDGSDVKATNVTAILLTNTGDECIEYVNITLERDGTQLKFVASALEAGGAMVVLEAEGTQFSKGEYSNCIAEVATMKEMVMSQEQVRVEENSEKGLVVTNISEEDITCVRIFYKFYMYDTDVYVGGITYTAKIVDLAAGDSVVVTPSHYLKGYSKIVMVKTSDSAD